MQPSLALPELQASPVGAGEKAVVVLVHGLGSSPACWAKLRELLGSDAAISERFEFAEFLYETSWINRSLLRRIPRLAEIADSLEAFLNDKNLRGREITLVGHSLGGLVIHGYLARMVSKSKGEQLKRIRQVITFATPHEGSTLLTGLRGFFFTFFKNAQERALRVHDPDVAEWVNTVKDRIAETREADAGHWPIPVSCFGGLSDSIVVEASARGPFSDYTPIAGDHFTILRPKNDQDERYRRFADLLLEPVGHPSVFEIASFDTTLTISPVSLEQQAPVETDNVATWERTIRFSPRNRCISPFKVRYRTRGGGRLEYWCNPPNEWSAEARGEFEDTGQDFVYQLTPKADEVYKIKLKIYKGFDAGKRKIHFHFKDEGELAKHYHSFKYSLDLNPYVNAGYEVTKDPALYFHSNAPESCQQCEDFEVATEEKPIEDGRENESWRWTWKLNDISRGAMTLVWDVAPPSKTGP